MGAARRRWPGRKKPNFTRSVLVAVDAVSPAGIHEVDLAEQLAPRFPRLTLLEIRRRLVRLHSGTYHGRLKVSRARVYTWVGELPREWGDVPE